MNNTIKDIALAAGVSKSTVSRVISGKGYASKETYAKVLNAIKELNYKPNGVARAMVSQRTNTIGVIIYRQYHPIASHPFYGKILDAILMKAESMNVSVFVTTDMEMSLSSADFMFEKRVDGLILISRLNQEIIRHIDESQVPYVMVNGTTDKEDIIQLVNQDLQGGRMMADHIYELGHRNVCVIAGPQKHRSHQLRYRGFCERMSELGCEVQPGMTYFSPTSMFADGYKGLTQSLEQFSNRKPTALFATNDMLALGATKALLEKGVRIPDQMAVAGFDNIDYSEMAYPPLTTVHVDKLRMGEDAVTLLGQLINNEHVKPRLIEYEQRLIVRESTKGYNR
ncbi:LacI family DNA-binding transcriptional regulator [Paenibacillus beijingensis]|uniref:LacI family transcriptional regulator n=1 Tax=Paenibacillus beijingensis TaxID=1126833 RepID=A0A0D5NFX5_9BACL|nr:LacI family DNA-binding transcriptional regulator [Paenibacillus beijingensis]AJY74050.1 LacI family transcriptional regulator [Paenibacillus beijingensis]